MADGKAAVFKHPSYKHPWHILQERELKGGHSPTLLMEDAYRRLVRWSLMETSFLKPCMCVLLEQRASK